MVSIKQTAATYIYPSQSINQSKALISVGQNVTDYSVQGKIKTVRISNSLISINVSEQLSNNKVAVISFCCKYKVMTFLKTILFLLYSHSANNFCVFLFYCPG